MSHTATRGGPNTRKALLYYLGLVQWFVVIAIVLLRILSIISSRKCLCQGSYFVSVYDPTRFTPAMPLLVNSSVQQLSILVHCSLSSLQLFSSWCNSFRSNDCQINGMRKSICLALPNPFLQLAMFPDASLCLLGMFMFSWASLDPSLRWTVQPSHLW